jgi:hypothetical protein
MCGSCVVIPLGDGLLYYGLRRSLLWYVLLLVGLDVGLFCGVGHLDVRVSDVLTVPLMFVSCSLMFN